MNDWEREELLRLRQEQLNLKQEMRYLDDEMRFYKFFAVLAFVVANVIALALALSH